MKCGAENDVGETIGVSPVAGLSIFIIDPSRSMINVFYRKIQHDHICVPANLFHILQIRRQTTMTAKYLLVDQRGDWKAIEAIGKRLPQFD